jgi:UDP-N-acetylglucosamine transferase subunit ALG13
MYHICYHTQLPLSSASHQQQIQAQLSRLPVHQSCRPTPVSKVQALVVMLAAVSCCCQAAAASCRCPGLPWVLMVLMMVAA